MKIAFVGIKRKYQELSPDYRDSFNRYHLELPYYFARDGGNDVTITTVDHRDDGLTFASTGKLRCVLESDYHRDVSYEIQDRGYDVVVHWRKWFPEFHKHEAINVINCQDHSFGSEWQTSAQQAFNDGKLYGILCFTTWHKRNLLKECPWLPEDRALDGVTLGVDTDIYRPSVDKDPYQMLWASDPGRGFSQAALLAVRLFQLDKRFRLHVCKPDYVKGALPFNHHPAIIEHGSISNCLELWNLFNSTGILPYTSTFMEPSSRSHRQAQAAGSLVFYPPGMGSPSELIVNDVTGIVAPILEWPARIVDLVKSGRWQEIGKNARDFAEGQNWKVQAENFNTLVHGIMQGR